MRYEVEVVGEDELPEGVHTVIVERTDGTRVTLINGEPAKAWRFARAYEDTQEPCTIPTIMLPARPLLYALDRQRRSASA